MKKKTIKIGQEVFIIERNLNISKKKVLAIVKEEKEIKYKLDVNSCNGITEKDFFLTNLKAEKRKQDFLDDLKFKIGDVLIFKQKEYNTEEIIIGRVEDIRFNGTPYTIRTAYELIHTLSDENIVLKVNNSYIENFGKLKELNKEFKEMEKGLNNIISQIHNEHYILEKELKQSFKKQFAWYNIKKKPLFKSRFNYRGEDW